MKKDLSHYRKSYEKQVLKKSLMDPNPFAVFKTWFEYVEQEYPGMETNAMTLSTIGADGFPQNRVVLLKEFDENGFVFFTNYNSQKGKAIATHPHVCISFFWPEAEKQVIIKGNVEKVSNYKSEEYFRSRPKGSQLGAVVSNQSAVIKNREVLENELKNLELKYTDSQVPKPKNWGGYVITPVEFEFWQGRANRLHDRIRYVKGDMEKWNIERLSP